MKTLAKKKLAKVTLVHPDKKGGANVTVRVVSKKDLKRLLKSLDNKAIG